MMLTLISFLTLRWISKSSAVFLDSVAKIVEVLGWRLAVFSGVFCPNFQFHSSDAKPKKATFLRGHGSAAQISNFATANDAKHEKATFLWGRGSSAQISHSTTGALVLVGYCFCWLVLKLDWEWAYLVVHCWVLVCEVFACAFYMIIYLFG